MPLQQVDPKLLRWIGEIIADGSEVRSLAGRNARLGDGTSRNPKDRDALLEQRSKDLKGVIGQVRGFSLEKYLSDYEEPGSVHPWGVGKDNYVPEETRQAREADRLQRGKALGGGAIDLMAPISEHSACLLYTSPSPRDLSTSRMPSSA